MSEDWQPAASADVLQLRARLLEKVREFMKERNIMEVDTPILSTCGIPYLNIEHVSARLFIHGKEKSNYLHTSPEACMKRLLAAGSGPIYQISKVFRNEESGRLHQPEFSMLEWYRPGFDHHDLMDELVDLLESLGLSGTQRSPYAEVFQKYLDVNPHTASLHQLQLLARKLGLHNESDNRSLLLEFLFSHSVSPKLGLTQPLLLHDYPACQSALARLTSAEPETAERFELFIQGMELANGFHELGDVEEQYRRFQLENKHRRESGKTEVSIDTHFLSALRAGLPDCAGVALGLDRLLMVMSGKSHINEVMTFPMLNA